MKKKTLLFAGFAVCAIVTIVGMLFFYDKPVFAQTDNSPSANADNPASENQDNATSEVAFSILKVYYNLILLLFNPV